MPNDEHNEEETQIKMAPRPVVRDYGLPEIKWVDATGAHVVRLTERVVVGTAPAAGIVSPPLALASAENFS